MTEPSQYFKGRTVQEQMNEVIGYVDVRSAEVATDAIAADVAQVHQDMLDADADAQAAAASAAAAAGTLATAVKKTGEASQSIAGDIAISGDETVGGDLGVSGDAGVQGQLSVLGGCDLRAPVTVPTPSNNTDAATKKYVDDQDALDVHLTGNQTVAGVKTFSSSPVVPTVATGTADTKAANGTKVKNELDNYSSMVRTTGNQNIGGIKSFTGTITIKSFNVDRDNPPAATAYMQQIAFVDMNGVEMIRFIPTYSTNGVPHLYLVRYKQDGTNITTELGV